MADIREYRITIEEKEKIINTNRIGTSELTHRHRISNRLFYDTEVTRSTRQDL